MSSQPNTLDPNQMQSVVAWLEEQRRTDRAELARLSTEVEHLTQIVREQANQLMELRSSGDASQSTLARLPIVDDSVRALREQLADLSERVDQNTQQVTQALLVRNVDSERDRKQLADLQQSVGQLEREDQQVNARLSALAEESRRERAHAADLPRQMAELETRANVAMHRSDQIEESIRRVEGHGAAHREELQAMRAEQARTVQWQQLADLRWTRQVAEWQQTIENWRKLVEDQARPIQQIQSHLAQVRDEIRTAQGSLTDHERRVEDQSAAVARLESAMAQQREAVARLEQSADAQRRRFDEQASAHLRLDESIGRVNEQTHALEHRFEDQIRDLEELRRSLRTAEGELSSLRDSLVQNDAALRRELDETRGNITRGLESLSSAASEREAHSTDVERLMSEHRRRLAGELEQQALEMLEILRRRGAS